ncbi:MAG: zinc-ribbon domain containing protein [Verrucomicrobiaceae bacterium]|nr:zinc-ribbon domain containing protein [Verrucomicrobiaceae bacterium]
MSAKIDKSREKWQRSLKASRSERIKVLIDRHYIQSESDLPAGAIPARPYLQNSKSGSRWAYTRAYYEDKTFVCADCHKQVRWSAEDQAWAYEVVGIPAISDLKRCTPCRIAFEKKRDEDVKRMHAARDRRRSGQTPR